VTGDPRIPFIFQNGGGVGGPGNYGARPGTAPNPNDQNKPLVGFKEHDSWHQNDKLADGVNENTNGRNGRNSDKKDVGNNGNNLVPMWTMRY
jgi:hypothetical protein